MLRSLRMCDEITQVDFAAKLKITKQDLSNIESGRSPVSIARATKFAKKLKMPPELFVRILLQEMVNKEGLKLEVELKSA